MTQDFDIRNFIRPFFTIFFILFIFTNYTNSISGDQNTMYISEAVKKETTNRMIEKYGEEVETRIKSGVHQVAARWHASDGSEHDFTEFCLQHFITNPEELNIMFSRFQQNLESLYGNLHRISRRFNWALHVDIGPVHPVDYLFANYDPFAHVSEDLFQTKLAFTALLNYPILPLDKKNEEGINWSRKKWAELRLVEEFSSRVPADVAQKRTRTYVAADDYISNYNIFMYYLVDEQLNRLFPEGLKLISHWGLRDELKAQYNNPDGFSRQKMIQKVMERIIRQEIPEQVINRETFLWNPYKNQLYDPQTKKVTETKAEPNTRYQHILNIFQAERDRDAYFPQAPSLIARRFNINREMAEQEVEHLLKEILTSDVLKDIASVIKERLGRPLEPFDIWYNGFKPQSTHSESELDEILSKRYPDVDYFQKDIATILEKLGFAPQKAGFLASHIDVDPSRGAGHAMGAMMRSDKAHLRTRIPDEGMKYKGFNIAIHELGHNVEQVFSLNGVDYYTLQGVPNTAFTEAFAFVFQSRDLEILGITSASEGTESLQAMNNLWSAFEISGVALTDMYIWRWMYENPEASPDQLKQATIRIAKQVWNEYFEPVLGHKNKDLLAIYSHIVDGGMYTPDYPLGYIISFQIEEYLKEHDLATEMERMCKLGRLSPQIWMQNAVGEKISAKPLIQAANKAVEHYGE